MCRLMLIADPMIKKSQIWNKILKTMKLISDADELCRKECVDGCQLDEN